tara:strand:+ start:4571 stop:4966 length:396 start_codon:yes stop_codon:yes gene_type:complete
MQNVELDVEELGENCLVDFYCPVTGQKIMGEGESGFSPATAFVYSDGVGSDSFSHLADEYKQFTNGIGVGDDIPADDDFFDNFCAAVDKDDAQGSLVLFVLNFEGTACGTISMNIYICIDMAYSAKAEIGA